MRRWYHVKAQKISLIPRPLPSFPWLAVRLSVLQVMGSWVRAWEQVMRIRLKKCTLCVSHCVHVLWGLDWSHNDLLWSLLWCHGQRLCRAVCRLHGCQNDCESTCLPFTPFLVSLLCSKLGKAWRKSSLLFYLTFKLFLLFFSTQLLGSLYQKWSLLMTCVLCVVKGSSCPLLTVQSQQRGRTDYPAITCILAFKVCCCCCCVYMFVLVWPILVNQTITTNVIGQSGT